MRNPILVAAAVLLAGCGPSYPEDDADYDEADESYEDATYQEEDGSDWLADLFVGLVIGAADGDDDEDDDGGGRPPAVVSRSDLVRGAAPSDPDARGMAAVARRRWRERFAVRVVGLDPGAPLHLFVADRFDVTLHIAALSADGRGVISYSPAFLPAGVASLEELAGRRVELRDGAGRVLLSGRVPALRGRGGDRRAARGYRDDGTGVRVKVSMGAVRSAGRQVFRFDARGLPPGAPSELRILDRDGRMVPAAAGTADASGRFSFRADSREGAPLPAGEEWIESLGGRPFEVSCGGGVVADGEFPEL